MRQNREAREAAAKKAAIDLEAFAALLQKKKQEEAAAALLQKKKQEEAAAALLQKKKQEEAAAALLQKKKEEEAAAVLLQKNKEEEQVSLILYNCSLTHLLTHSLLIHRNSLSYSLVYRKGKNCGRRGGCCQAASGEAGIRETSRHRRHQATARDYWSLSLRF